MAKPIAYGMIGTGARAASLAGYLSKRKDDVFLKAIFEPDEATGERFLARFGQDRTVRCRDYRELLADGEIEWVIVASPNCFHKAHTISALRAGKCVFAEKPLATSIEDCVAINDAHAAADGLLFATGFVLRYAPLYRKVKELLDAGVIGKVVTVEANENITAAHGGHIMTCWRRFSQQSGSHMLEKCCHDMDLLNWLIGSLPSKVASFGGNNIFIPQNEELLNKFTPPEGKSSIYLEWNTPSRDAQNPFTSEKTVIDNQVAIIEYRNGVRATFQTVMNNAIPERRMYFAGTEGTLIAELYTGRLRYRRLGADQQDQSFDFSGAMHGGGDEVIADQLVESMITGAQPACSGEEGLTSAVVSLGIEDARLAGRIMDLEPVWDKLGLSK